MRQAEDKITVYTSGRGTSGDTGWKPVLRDQGGDQGGDTHDQGLTMVHRHARGAAVEYFGAIVHVGSRDDSPELHGMAHFVEHTIFKGTERRQSWHIINRMERVGGELNAYTTKEETVVYTAAPAGNLERSVELIADLLTSSRFPDSELDKEREVVCDEINSYLDTPADAVYDDFEDLIFAGTPLGHNILGDADSISRIHSQTCREYLHHWYTRQNLTIFYYGPASPESMRRRVERHFAALPDHRVEHVSLPAGFAAPVFEQSRNIDSHQAHTVMGAVTPGRYSPDRYTNALLTNILGGPGMNSLLNVSLRERRGLVYSVEANTSLMSDCGLFTIYFGCDPEDTERCKRLVREQIDRLCQHPMSDRALAAAKKQYLGQLAVASDSRESLAISTGRDVLYYGEVKAPEYIARQIQSITPEQIMQAARSLSNLSCLTLTQI